LSFLYAEFALFVVVSIEFTLFVVLCTEFALFVVLRTEFAMCCCFSRYLNQQHIKKQQLTEAEIIYGPLGSDAQEQMEIGELGLCSKQFLM